MSHAGALWSLHSYHNFDWCKPKDMKSNDKANQACTQCFELITARI